MSKTLLLADDSVTIQKVVGISFASEDVVLIAVDNGDDAIARAREERPDAILADVVMPGKNGYEVCEAIKADPALAHIPVLLLTGTFEAFDAERAERVGAAGHIAKPFESQTLVDLVANLFASGSAPAVAAPENTEPPAALEQPPILETSTEPTADAFDFFDDDLETADVVGEPEPLNTGESLESASESAFAFGDADLSPIAETADSFAEPLVAAVGSDLGPLPTAEIQGSAVSSADDNLAPIQAAREDTVDRELGHDLRAAPDLEIGDDLRAGIHSNRGQDINQDIGAPIDNDLRDDLSLESQLEIDSDLGEPISAGARDESIQFDDTPAPDDSLAPPDAGTSSGEDPFDFAFEPTSGDELDPLALSDSGLVDSSDLAQATTLYPEGGSDFDVSSSDLGPVAENPSETTILLDSEESEYANDEVLEPEPIGELILESSDDLSQGSVSAPALSAQSISGLTEPVLAEPGLTEPESSRPGSTSPGSPAEEVEAQPIASATLLADSDPLAVTDPVAHVPDVPAFEAAPPSIEPAFEPATDEPSGLAGDSSADSAAIDEPFVSEGSAESSLDTAARAESVLERIEPQLKEQLHDTLEKIAWESFGDLTAAIVRQSVEKVEQIAWEVVPQLIETIVREEIRKMKGEPPSDA